MRTEGYLIDNETGIGFKILVVDIRPCIKFPHGAYALKVAQTQRILFAYDGRAPESGVLFGIRQAALKHGYLLCYKGDEPYDELVKTATPVDNTIPEEGDAK